jgi:hypothetical protein
MTTVKKTCYIISPIGEIGSPTRKHADLVFDYIIKPAVIKAGFGEPIRADSDHNPSVITNSILKHVYEDDLVVALLSGKNPNVFYELALRHAIKKPCVHLIDSESWPPPFDLAAMNMIRYDLSDWTSPQLAIDQLVSAIQISESKDALITNPISSYLAVQDLIKSDDPEKRKDGLIAERFQIILDEINSLRRNFNSSQKVNNNLMINDLFSSAGAASISSSNSSNLGTLLSDYSISNNISVDKLGYLSDFIDSEKRKG